jgi:hypothetical protein
MSTFEEARQAYYSSWSGEPSSTRLQGWETGWHARDEELAAKDQIITDLQGIDKVADHANEVIGLMQKDIDTLTVELAASREKIQAERAAVLTEAAKRLETRGKWIESVPAKVISASAIAEFDKAVAELLSLISTTDRLALDRYVEEKVREARLAEAEIWNNNAGVKRLDLTSDWAIFRLNQLRAVPAAPEAVCPRCEGEKFVLDADSNSRSYSQCPDCHGTGKRADAEEKR